MKNFNRLLLVFFFFWGACDVFGQMYNDGPIRLRVWAHKVWSSSNCGELGNNEYAIENIQARVLSGGGASYITSPSGFNCSFWGPNNRYYSFSPNQMHAVNTAGRPLQAQGYNLIDVTYSPGVSVPKQFEVYTATAYEEDCTGDFLSCGQGSELNFDECCCVNIPFVGRVCASGDDYAATSSSWQTVNFRGGNNGVVNYTQPILMTASGEHRYAVVFAYQWDWVNPQPVLCASPNYQDGPINITADFVGFFADNDWDGGTCGISVSGDEDLRVKFRTKDNISAFPAWPVSAYKFNQDVPKWNNVNSNIFTRNYTISDVNMQSVDIEYDIWEDDGFETTVFGNLYRPCGDVNWDDNYNPNCCVTILGFTVCWDGDDNRATGSFSINWRNSPPNTDNFIEIPVRIGSGQYENYIARIKYRWTLTNPTATITPSLDRTLCIGTPTTLTATATNATWYQWQVTSSTGPTPPACPASGWSNVVGANCPSYTPPQTPGTRIYRLMVYNRNGSGSVSATGAPYVYGYSECVRVSYFPYAPPVSSPACGASITSGTAVAFSVPVVPAVGAVANATAYTWSVSPSSGVTISAPNSTSTNITFANTGTYTVTMTITDVCGAANATSTCNVNVTTSSCGYVYLSTTGNDVNPGTESQPKLTFANAIALANSSSTKHIRVASGTYNVSAILDIESNILIEGGFNSTTSPWTKNENLTTTISLTGAAAANSNQEHIMGLRSASKTGWKLQDLNITTGAASGQAVNGQGKSNYAIYISNTTNYTILRCNVTSGNATAGNPGTTYGTATKGGDGGNGTKGQSGADDCNPICTGCCQSTQNGGSGGAAGLSGTGANAGATGFSGGAGGRGGNDCCSQLGFGGNNGGGPSPGGGGGAGSWSGGITSGGGGGAATANGANGANGATGVVSYAANFFLPGTGSAGAGGSGGSGGGGGGGGSINNDGCEASANAGSGAGGGGGGGGGGWPGRGGGGTFALFIATASSGEVLTDSRFTPGTAGAAGAGGPGGGPGLGGSGFAANTDCNNCGRVNQGGRGGNGSQGGSGGAGGSGSAGVSFQKYSIPAAASSNPTTTLPKSPVTAQYALGCTYSQIPLTKTGITWNNFDAGGFLLEDNYPGSSTYGTMPTTSAAPVIYYTTPITGNDAKDLTVDGVVYRDAIYIRENRLPPQINVSPNIVCSGETINMRIIATNNITSGVALPISSTEWRYRQFRVNNVLNLGAWSAPIYGGAPNVAITNNTTDSIEYLFAFRTQDACCGYSIWVYDTVTVYPAINPATAWTSVPANGSNVCIKGAPATLSVNVPTGQSGGTSGATFIYRYSTDGGTTWTAWSTTRPTAIPKVIGNTIVESAFVTTTYSLVNGPFNCDTAYTTLDINWTINDSVTATANIADITACGNPNGSATLISVNPSGGTGQWTQISGTAASSPAVPTAANTLNISNIPWGSGNNIFAWTVTNGACSDVVYDTLVVANNNTSVITNDTLNCFSCTLTDGNTYTFFDYQGYLVCKIEDLTNSLDLGATEVCIRRPTPNMAPTPRVITNGYNDLMPYLRRYFSISPSLSNAPDALARVTLYFTVSEFNNLVLASAGTPYAFGSASDLRVSKFPGGGGMAFSGPNNILAQNNVPGGEMIVEGGYAGSHPNWTTPIFANYAGNGVDYEVSFTIDEFSTFYIHPVRFNYEVLPVELVSFTGTNIGDKNRLDWVTASEQNTSRFVVEKSLDGVNWFYLGEKPAAGNSNQTINYELFDNTPVIGNNYYRLKIIDLDETFTYSNIVIIKLNTISADGIAGVFPNPSSGTFTLLLSSADNQQSFLKVYDILGRILINRAVEVVEGTNTIDINLHNFANATYILEYTNSSGNTFKYKLIKQ